jgi:hypothetical protein
MHGARLRMLRARSVKPHWTDGRYLAVYPAMYFEMATNTQQNEQEVQ